MDFSSVSELIDDGEESFLASDEKYAEELQLQEALLSSAVASRLMIGNNSKSPETTGESFCGICLDSKENSQMFITGSCCHSFCSDCISQHVMTNIQDSRAKITCPEVNCNSVLKPHDFRTLLAKEVIGLWGDALCREVIHPSQKLYCPCCSEMFVIDDEGEEIRRSECPFCHILFCAKCGVPWHHGLRCEEYGRTDEGESNSDDHEMRELAKKEKWRNCPNCKFYVERTDGCPHMTCRCKFEFCYLCGEEWKENHGGCQTN